MTLAGTLHVEKVQRNPMETRRHQKASLVQMFLGCCRSFSLISPLGSLELAATRCIVVYSGLADSWWVALENSRRP
jgi:hypothetical protein